VGPRLISCQILKISIYVKHVRKDDRIGRRVTVTKGSPDWRTIVREEVEGKYIRKVQEEHSNRDDMIVMVVKVSWLKYVLALTSIVSASVEIRNSLRDLLRDYLDDKVDLVELECQPA